MKVSDYVANFLADNGVKHVFTISGSGNVHLLDSIATHPKLEYICVHHEQAGVMAANAYGRISGRPGVMLTTSGGGASNAITGVLDAWLDSVPLIVLSGQERTAFANPDNPSRVWGLQGWDVPQAVKGFTKYAVTMRNSLSVRFHMEKAISEAFGGRPGPVWLDFPTDIQADSVDPLKMAKYQPKDAPLSLEPSQVSRVISLLENAERPVVLLGRGVRQAGAAGLVSLLMSALPVPFLTSWAAADLVATKHKQHFGHSGSYGSRCGNFVIQNSDLVIVIGSRLAEPQVGYNFNKFAREAKKVLVNIDLDENLGRFGDNADVTLIHADAAVFILELISRLDKNPVKPPNPWLECCEGWREKYPNPDPEYSQDVPGFINSYNFTTALSHHFTPDEIITMDVGTAFTCTHQSIELSGAQRLVGSRGLGEMGFGLPAAIGACIANDKKRVILFTGDGSIMLNLQELQTVATNRLPIKAFLYVNNGYLAIRATQRSTFGDRYPATGKDTGVVCPDMRRVFDVFGFETFRLTNPDDMDSTIKQVLSVDGPAMCEVVMQPDQPIGPRLRSLLQPDGTIISPPMEDMYPFLDRDEFNMAMIVAPYKNKG
jgi:acetolactate synthase-1/2/3 large subunit